MRVTTRLTIDMNTGATLVHEWYEYDGAVELCKHDDGGGDKAVGLSIYRQGLFQQTLMQAFKTQFGNQQNILNLLKNTLTPNLTNPQGFDQATKAALNSSAINQSAVDTQNAIKATQTQAAAHGGATSLPSGVQEQIAGQINATGAAEKSSALSNIQLQDEQLKQANYWNSVNALNGLAAQENPLGYASNATGAAGSIGALDQTYMASREYNSSLNFGSQLGRSLGGSAVKGLTGAIGGAFFGG